MSNYHRRMINIPASGDSNWSGWKAYLLGHRDARHAAAEIANEADARIEELEATAARSCVWTLEDEDDDVWKTACDELHSFATGTPAENDYRFCPYCGGKIKEGK